MIGPTAMQLQSLSSSQSGEIRGLGQREVVEIRLSRLTRGCRGSWCVGGE